MATQAPPPPDDVKICGRCGRQMQWRRAWARSWATQKYCSDACRRQRPGAVDAALQQTIVALLQGRARGATICPSEAARAVLGPARGLQPASMERCRAAARLLVAAGRIDIVQGGRVVDPSTARGPIRLRLRPTASR